MFDIATYEFQVPSVDKVFTKKLKITYDLEFEKYQHWLFIDELTDPEKKWVKVDKTTFRSEMRIYQRYIEEAYGSINKNETPFQQLSLF